MSREETNQIRYIVALIAEFAKKFNLGQRQAFNYLKRFKGFLLLFTSPNQIFIHAKKHKYRHYYIAYPCQATIETVSLQHESRIIFMKNNFFFS